MNGDLKPCPFCGDDCAYAELPELMNDSRFWKAVVYCGTCGASVTGSVSYRSEPLDAVADAKTGWNMRVNGEEIT